VSANIKGGKLRKVGTITVLALILVGAALWGLAASASSGSVKITAQKTTGDPTSADDPIWAAIQPQGIKTNGNPRLGGHGAVGDDESDLPDVKVKAAFSDEYLYMYAEWADSNNDNLHSYWTFNGAAWNKTREEVNEDRLYFMWPIVDTPGREGKTFAQSGCSATCHRFEVNPENGKKEIVDTPEIMGACAACHDDVEGPAKTTSYVGHEKLLPNSPCWGCHGLNEDFEAKNHEPNTEADMIATAGGAYDLWHWKAGRAGNIGFTDDQSTVNGVARGNDGGPGLDSDNAAGAKPRYIWPVDSGKNETNLVKKSELSSSMFELSPDGLYIKDTTTTVPAGTKVRAKIVNDMDASPANLDLPTEYSYAGGKYRVVIKRKLNTGDAKDYQFQLNEDNLFSIAVTNNSAAAHAGSAGPHLLILDTKNPAQAQMISPVYSTNVSKTTKFKVSWSAADNSSPSSGVAGYDVRYKVGKKGAWNSWKENTPATSHQFKARAGRTYYFQARAIDRAGNVGAWSTAKRTIVPFDNNSLIASRSGFGSTAKSLSSGFYLGTTRYSTKRGHKITYEFTGKSVALIGPKAKSRSKAKIYINGKYVKTIDAYSSTLKHRQVLFSKTWTKSGTRTITIENLGTSGRNRFDVDGLGVGK
jgi:hypothetical protein